MISWDKGTEYGGITAVTCIEQLAACYTLLSCHVKVGRHCCMSHHSQFCVREFHSHSLTSTSAWLCDCGLNNIWTTIK